MHFLADEKVLLKDVTDYDEDMKAVVCSCAEQDAWLLDWMKAD